jgi:predicted DNA-binding transcriptional regulator AlpA
LSQTNTIATPRELLSDTELATYLGVKVSTLRKWRVLREGPTWIKLGSLVRYRLADVNAFLDSCPKGGAPANG